MAGVEAVIGGGFIAGIIKEVVKTGRSYLAGKYKEHKGTQKMLDNLEASLPRILFAIKFAEQKTTVQHALLKEWLRQLKDVAYEARDVMDDFEAKRISSKNKGKVSKIATSSGRAFTSLFWSDKDEKKLKDLIEKIKNICDGIGNFTEMLKSGNYTSDGANSSSRETSYFLPKTKKIFGREEEIKLILDIIFYTDIQSYVTYPSPESGHDHPYPVIEETIGLSQDTQKSPAIKREELGHESSSSSNLSLGKKKDSRIERYVFTSQHSYVDYSFSVGERLTSVLPIVGIGGVGKTTIARVIYNDRKVRDHFDLRGWVHVADNIDQTKIVQDTLHSFVPGTNIIPTINSLNDGHHMLKKTITKKKFLIIFDDVSEGTKNFDSTWAELLKILAEGPPGSIVIVTTEINSVADRLGTLPSIYLNVLDWKEFLSLFEYNAFNYSNNKTGKPYDKTVLKPIGEEIAKKLGGLPLAAEVVGTLLSTNPDKNHWEMILKSNWWDHENISEKILLSLGGSLQNLDPDLQQCFLYCSLFPKNHVFDKDRLVQMWMAHGLIHPTTEVENIKLETNKLKIEDIGHSVFDKLVDRFFFQTTVLENRYVMHDLIREFAIATSSEMLYANGNYLINNKTIPSSVRHLSIDPNIADDVYVDHIKWSNKEIQSLQTLMFFGFCKMKKDKGLQDILDKLRGLRILDLSYFRLSPIGPSDFGQLSHVRFLDLSFSGINEVPNSLCQLVHLQFLDIRGHEFWKLPNGINRLINLRHLYASPKTISLIRGIGSLTNLQQLEEFSVKNVSGFTISELKDLNSLKGQLTLNYLSKVPSKEMAITAALEDKRCLTSLIFDMSYKHSKPGEIFDMSYEHYNDVSKRFKHVEVLEGLRPHNNIRELKILGFQGNSFPSWIMELHKMNNLRSIKLTSCHYVESLPPLGSLPKLEVLILVDLKSIICIGEEFYGSSHVIFSSLKELSFSGLRRWEHWLHTGERQLFPCLEKLKITNCKELSEAPLDCLSSSMVELYLSSCDKVTEKIVTYLANMTSLRELYLEVSPFKKIHLCCDNLGELQDLTLGGTGILPHLKGQSCSLVNLKKLRFLGWERVEDLPSLQSALQTQHMHCLPSLTCIEFRDCSELPSNLLSLGRLPSLQTLLISNYECYETNEFTSDEESWLSGLTSLEEMEVTRCNHLKHLPTSLSSLPSLKKFTIRDCPKICSLPQEGLPRGLKELHIIECSDELMQGCEPNTGKEWSKISHIPYIRVHGKKRRALTNYDQFQ